MKMKNKIEVMGDGRVEIMLLAPLSLSRYGRRIKFYTHGSELVIEGDKMTGIRSYPKVWEKILKRDRPELLESFRKLLEKQVRSSGKT